LSYRWRKSNTPTTMASTARTSPLWVKLNLKNDVDIRPYKMSQTASKIIPKFFGSFIGALLDDRSRYSR
jgi:hypothetical protein